MFTQELKNDPSEITGEIISSSFPSSVLYLSSFLLLILLSHSIRFSVLTSFLFLFLPSSPSHITELPLLHFFHSFILSVLLSFLSPCPSNSRRYKCFLNFLVMAEVWVFPGHDSNSLLFICRQ